MTASANSQGSIPSGASFRLTSASALVLVVNWPPSLTPFLMRFGVAVTRAPFFLRTSDGCSWKGLGGSRGDCSWWSPFEGLHDTAALGSPEAADRLQEDAP